MPKAMPMMVGTFVLLLAAIVLIFLPDVVKQVETLPLQTSVPTTPIVTPPEVPVLPAAPLPPVLVPPAITASAPVVVAPTPLVAASKPAALPAAVNVNSILRIEAKGVVWVEVKDSKGAVLIQRTLQPKEVANVSGQPPLAVVVGRINEIASVMVRGKPLSMDGMSPDNVARFEVK
jgi:cytoskeleton protein RodZ